MNWRIKVKELVKDKLKPVYNPTFSKGINTLDRFDYWNNQNQNLSNQTEAVPRFSIYFEWAQIGAEKQFTRQTNLDSASFIPVQFTIHVLLSNFGELEDATDKLYEYAYAVKLLLSNLQDEMFTRRLELVSEKPDINHDAHLEYQITFRTVVKDKVNATSEIKDINETTIAIKEDNQTTHTNEDINITTTIIREV